MYYFQIKEEYFLQTESQLKQFSLCFLFVFSLFISLPVVLCYNPKLSAVIFLCPGKKDAAVNGFISKKVEIL